MPQAKSKLENPTSMRNALVEMIGCELVTKKRDVKNFVQTTLLCHQKGLEFSMKEAEKAIEELKSKFFIKIENGIFSATKLGTACFNSSMKTENAHDYQKELSEHRENGIIQSNDLHIIILSMKENDNPHIKIFRSNHKRYVTLFQNLDKTSQNVAKLFKLDISELERVLIKDLNSVSTCRWNRFFLGCALNDLLQEKSIRSVSEKYGIERGSLQKMQESVSISSCKTF